jgi:hypothetical protein
MNTSAMVHHPFGPTSLSAPIKPANYDRSDEYLECSDAKDRKFFSAIRSCADRLRVSRRHAVMRLARISLLVD